MIIWTLVFLCFEISHLKLNVSNSWVHIFFSLRDHIYLQIGFTSSVSHWEKKKLWKKQELLKIMDIILFAVNICRIKCRSMICRTFFEGGDWTFLVAIIYQELSLRVAITSQFYRVGSRLAKKRIFSIFLHCSLITHLWYFHSTKQRRNIALPGKTVFGIVFQIWTACQESEELLCARTVCLGTEVLKFLPKL